MSSSIADSIYNYNDTITEDDGFRIAVGFDPRSGAENVSEYLKLSVGLFYSDFSGD